MSLPKDQNRVTAAGGVWNDGSGTIVPLPIDPVTGGLLINVAAGSVGLTVGTTIVTGATNGYVLYNNNGVLGAEAAGSSGTVTSVSVVTANGISGTVATATTTPAITLTLGAITPTSVNSVVISGALTPTLAVTGTSSISGSNTGDQTNVSGTAANVTGVVAPANGGTGIANNAASTLTISGNYATTLTVSGATSLTLPTTGTVAVLGTAQTFTGNQSFNQILDVVSALTVSSNAITVPITYRQNKVTNNAAGAVAITLATTSAVDGELCMVIFYDYSAASQTITWVNTEVGVATPFAASKGSTTLPTTAGFRFNGATSKWNCLFSS
jgi:hypothetical protein